jgi:hypothetical protein
VTTQLSGFGLMWTGHGIAWSRRPQPTLRNPAGRAEAASGCAASARARATTCGGTEASACLAAVIDDPAPPGDANPTSGTTMNITHKTRDPPAHQPPFVRKPFSGRGAPRVKHVDHSEWRRGSSQVVGPSLTKPGAEREDVRTDQLLLRASFVNTGARKSRLYREPSSSRSSRSPRPCSQWR